MSMYMPSPSVTKMSTVAHKLLRNPYRLVEWVQYCTLGFQIDQNYLILQCCCICRSLLFCITTWYKHYMKQSSIAAESTVNEAYAIRSWLTQRQIRKLGNFHIRNICNNVAIAVGCYCDTSASLVGCLHLWSVNARSASVLCKSTACGCPVS
jgi:hypothetical protein